MTQIETNYAIVLYELGVPQDIVTKTKQIFDTTPILLENLTSPVVENEAKHRIIDRIFANEMKSFLKVLCDYQSIGSIHQIFQAYEKYYNEQQGILTASLYYVTEPTEKEIQGFNRYLVKRHNMKVVKLHLVEEPQLLGGFVLRVKDYEIDWSLKGRLEQLKQILIRR